MTMTAQTECFAPLVELTMEAGKKATTELVISEKAGECGEPSDCKHGKKHEVKLCNDIHCDSDDECVLMGWFCKCIPVPEEEGGEHGD